MKDFSVYIIAFTIIVGIFYYSRKAKETQRKSEAVKTKPKSPQKLRSTHLKRVK